MTTHDTQRDCWNRAAAKLKAWFDSDHRNHRMLAAPWHRAVHSMVQGWQIIASQGRLRYLLNPRQEITTWDQAARLMKSSLDARRRTQLEDQTSWQFWAGHLPRPDRRYIAKVRRGRLDL